MTDRDYQHHHQQQHQQQQHHPHPAYHYGGGSFDRNLPRPPVPGMDRDSCVSECWPTERHHKTRPTSPPSRKSSNAGSCFVFDESLERPVTRNDVPPSGNCLRWAKSLQELLEDPDGVAEFRKYLEAEGRHHADALDFWFACKGLRTVREPERVHQIIKVIYRKYFVKCLLPIPDELRREVSRRVKMCSSSDLGPTPFDDAQSQVENLINNTTYPNFLKSDTYLQLVQLYHNPNGGTCSDATSESSSSSSSASQRDIANMQGGPDPLPIIYEDSEFCAPLSGPMGHTPGTGYHSAGYLTPNCGSSVRLTKDMLLVTQKHRADVRPKPEAYVDSFYRGMLPQHLSYNSYNPVSRQDSERQSLSSHSDARTESDNMSLVDSSADGKCLSRSTQRKAMALEARQARELAALNKETHLHQAVIPRTQRLDTRQCQPQIPSHFAAILIEKLKNVKKDRESDELLERKLRESDSTSSLHLANAIRDKLQVEDDNDQDILDQHVSRVFSDLTPTTMSPRSRSPTRCGGGGTRWPAGYLRPPRRKDKDGFSTFSSDSGNVRDYHEHHSDASMSTSTTATHKMVKSKSMPEYADERLVRGSAGRRSSSRKTLLTDLTDSGVSVVSDTPPSSHNLAAPGKETRVLAWLMDSDTGPPHRTSSSNYSHSEMSSSHNSKHRGSSSNNGGNRATSVTSPGSKSHRKGGYGGSRSSSLERGNAGSGLPGPAQPFVADPKMPPLPIPNTAVQLEEARRRLMEEDLRSKSRQRNSSKFLPDTSQSMQSTLRKSMRASKSSTYEELTTVVYSFYDEKVPYRTKIPGKQITLRQFKEFLPKKGNYRYFFKTECEELDNQVIQEEISNDMEVLPTYEGKIMAQVKPLD